MYDVKPEQINPGAKLLNKTVDTDEKDPWKGRSSGMKCNSCMFYVAKVTQSAGNSDIIGRCRRNAPTMNGYPVVYPTDWCGEHRTDEEKLLCG